MTRALTVAVLGAGGTIAPAIVQDLAESEEVAAMRLLDLDESAAAALATARGGGKATSAGADARSGLASSLEGCDVLVNSASYRVNLDAMGACVEAGCHYMDLGGLYWMTGRQLELHGEFESAGLVALLGIGSSPGKTNVMAVRAAREVAPGGRWRPGDAREVPIDAVHVSAAGRDLQPPSGFSVPYALQTLIDELTMAPVVIEDGRATEVEEMASGGRVAFGHPIGDADTIHTLHSEMRTFPESFGCSEASFRLSLGPALVEELRALVKASPQEIAEAARRAVPPSAETVSVHVIDAYRRTGESGGMTARVTAVTRPKPDWGLGGGVVSTAAPAAAAVRLLARDRITERGAVPPERCIDPDDLFPELERRGAEFRVETEEAVPA